MRLRTTQEGYYRDRIIALAPVSYWMMREHVGNVAQDEMGINPGAYQNSPSLALALVGSAGETIDSVSTSNAGVATISKSGNAASVNLLSAGTATLTITPQVVSGFNNSDFAITVQVSVEAQIGAITGTGVAVLTASAVCDLEV